MYNLKKEEIKNTMKAEKLSKEILEKITFYQRCEITEYLVYSKLADMCKNKKNAQILRNIAEDEKKHYLIWKSVTKKDVKPRKFDMFKHVWISRIFGLTFGLRLMEQEEIIATDKYKKLGKYMSKAIQVNTDEKRHEKELISLINEKRLEYISSIVLGLNDALVELTGALAGFSLAFGDSDTIAKAGFVTGVAASLSMAASSYLSTKADSNNKPALTAAAFTGTTYITAVFILITPFVLINKPFAALGASILSAIIIIFLFTFYISIAKGFSFKQKFFEMASITIVVATISFAIGHLIK